MLNTSAYDVDSMDDDQPMGCAEHSQVMREHTPLPQPLASASWPETPQTGPLPWTPESSPLYGVEMLWLVTSQKPHTAVPTLREAETAGNTLDVDLDHILLSKLAGGDSIPYVPRPDVPLPEAQQDGSVVEE
jgi:hypothetical protein